MTQIKVNLGERSYFIETGEGILLKTDFSRFGKHKYAIITDSNVKELYGKDLLNTLIKQGLEAELLDFPAGEASKTPEMATSIGREIVRKGLDRDSMIIALGGGVAGDLAGYVASFFEREIDYIQVPTTLMAQVDSSIGGKTGVNIPEGKNLFGRFHQPKAVITDIRTLCTLPKKEIGNGIAEVIKYGMTQDKELFEYLEKYYFESLYGDDKFYSNIIEKSCSIKAKIVEKDEKEGELRKILNYGHTIGHAIEAAENYKISHGEAVGLGMVFEGKIANRLSLLEDISYERQNELIKFAGLPVSYKGNIDFLIEVMGRDKKSKFGKLYFILPTGIGKVKEEKGKISCLVDEAVVRGCLKG